MSAGSDDLRAPSTTAALLGIAIPYSAPHLAPFQGVRSSVSVSPSAPYDATSAAIVPLYPERCRPRSTLRSHALVHWISPFGRATSSHHILSSGVPLEDGDKRRVSPPLAPPPIFCSLLRTRGPRGNPPYGCGGARHFHNDIPTRNPSYFGSL